MGRHRASGLIVVAALAGWSIAGARAAQNPQNPPQPPQFRLGINLTQIDVTVLGPDGRPARGLAREDFTLHEDGESQEILGFAEIYIPDGGDGPAWLKDAAPDVRTPADGRILVFLLDDAQTRDDLLSADRLRTVRRIAGDVVDRMGPTDVAAVVCTYDTRCAQDFTNDRALLKAAIGRFTPKQFDARALNPGRFDRPYDWYRQSAGVSKSVVEYLKEQPGRRKALIYVTARQPTRPLVWPPAGGDLDKNATDQQVIRTFEQAQQSRITVYTINPSGLLSLSGPDEDEALASAPASPLSVSPRFTAAARSLALETGGFTIQRPEQFAEGVAQIFRETGSYYLLGYEQPPKKDTGYNMIAGLRQIDVRINRPGFDVRSRVGYVVPRPEPPPKNPPPAGSAALAGILPKTDLPLRVAVAPFAVPGQAEAVLAVTLAVGEPAPAQRTLERVKVQLRAFTQRGEARGMKQDTVDMTIPAGRDGEVYFELISDLRLKPGVYALRFSAESERLGKAGAVYADVEIPDFTKAPLSMSGVLLSAIPKPPVARADALAAIVPVVPTTLREFPAGHSAEAFVRVYQGGKAPAVPVVVTSTVLNELNVVVAEDKASFDAARFGAGRAADYRYALPLNRVRPGLYLLRIQATAGAATTRRDIRFIVR